MWRMKKETAALDFFTLTLLLAQKFCLIGAAPLRRGSNFNIKIDFAHFPLFKINFSISHGKLLLKNNKAVERETSALVVTLRVSSALSIHIRIKLGRPTSFSTRQRVCTRFRWRVQHIFSHPIRILNSMRRRLLKPIYLAEPNTLLPWLAGWPVCREENEVVFLQLSPTLKLYLCSCLQFSSSVLETFN